MHDPVSGRVPGGDELDILSAMAEHAALAIQGAQETAAAPATAPRWSSC